MKINSVLLRFQESKHKQVGDFYFYFRFFSMKIK
uniref:Uncharacterized protein n=1 Tax=Populus trichocarpa TaxID=3694 RepID=A0A3N7GGC1_POPTR